MKNHRALSKLIREAFGDPIGSYAGQSMIGVRDEALCDCGCGMPASECECDSHDLTYAQGDYCPVCDASNKKCNCDEMNENAPISTASAKAQYYPKGDELTKNATKNAQNVPSNKITGATMGNKIAGNTDRKEKSPKRTPPTMKEPKEPRV